MPPKVRRSGKPVTVRLPARVRQELDLLAKYKSEAPAAIVRRWIIQGVVRELPPSWRAQLSSKTSLIPDSLSGKGSSNGASVSSKRPAGMPIGTDSDSARCPHGHDVST